MTEATPLPGPATSDNVDDGTNDDPKQSLLADVYNLIQKFNTLHASLDHLTGGDWDGTVAAFRTAAEVYSTAEVDAALAAATPLVFYASRIVGAGGLSGSADNGAWRDFPGSMTERRNNIPGATYNAGSGVLTLTQNGSYRTRCRSMFRRTGNSQLRVTKKSGTGAFSDIYSMLSHSAASGGSNTFVTGEGLFTLNEAGAFSVALEVQYQVENTTGTNGFGEHASWGNDFVSHDWFVQKIA